MRYSVDSRRLQETLGSEEELRKPHKGKELRKLYNITASSTDKADPAHSMRDALIDIDQIRNASLFEEHRVFGLINTIQYYTDRVTSLINNGETAPGPVALLDHQRDRIGKLKGILELHFDVLESIKSITGRVHPDSEANIYTTVLHAINPAADILDEKEIEVDINGLKRARFTHSTKAMGKTIALLLGLLAQAAKNRAAFG